MHLCIWEVWANDHRGLLWFSHLSLGSAQLSRCKDAKPCCGWYIHIEQMHVQYLQDTYCRQRPQRLVEYHKYITSCPSPSGHIAHIMQRFVEIPWNSQFPRLELKSWLQAGQSTAYAAWTQILHRISPVSDVSHVSLWNLLPFAGAFLNRAQALLSDFVFPRIKGGFVTFWDPLPEHWSDHSQKNQSIHEYLQLIESSFVLAIGISASDRYLPSHLMYSFLMNLRWHSESQKHATLVPKGYLWDLMGTCMHQSMPL